MEAAAQHQEKASVISNADATFAKLEDMIVLGELKPGVMYSEGEIADLVGFGRTPVREALQRLAIEGLVIIKQRKGIQIAEIDADAELQLLGVRRPIQNYAAEYAARRISAADAQRLRRYADALDRQALDASISRAQALASVRRSHDLIIDASQNIFVKRTLRVVQGLSRRFWMHHMTRDDFPVAARLHSALLRAVATGSPDEAVAASDALMNHLEQFAQKAKGWDA